MAHHYKVRTLDELQPLVGQELAVGAWVEVTQEMIAGFAEITGDRQWIHLDAERACRESPYGTTIAHGFLTLSLISRLHGENVVIDEVKRVINYGVNKVRFPNAVPAGAKVRARSVLQAWERIGDAVQLTWQITVEVEGQTKPVLVAEWILRGFA